MTPAPDHDSAARSASTDADRPAVLVLMGGPDAEREISIESGRAISDALRQADRCDVIEQVIDQPSAEDIAAMGGDVIFPALHGRWGEGGPLQDVLEQVGRPYVGARPDAAFLTMDKLASKRAVEAIGVPTPPACLLGPDDACTIDPPLVLKPVDDGSSVDLRVCRTHDEVAAARAELHSKRPTLLAERFIAGRELTVGVLDDRVLPIVEVIPADGTYDFAAKYERNDTRYVVDPDLGPAIGERLIAFSRRAFEALGSRDVARMDFLLSDEVSTRGVWFLEVNTMPGFTSHSLFPMAAARAGLEMPALCQRLVDAALSRRNDSGVDASNGVMVHTTPQSRQDSHTPSKASR